MFRLPSKVNTGAAKRWFALGMLVLAAVVVLTSRPPTAAVTEHRSCIVVKGDPGCRPSK
jgi:hypothetical protein